MDVSRNSVREALSALQILGIIESRAGDGTYVCNSVGNELEYLFLIGR
ncbi:MAG: GntR family transcriptional regulator [Candidatus Methanomethylicaceae archaeon]